MLDAILAQSRNTALIMGLIALIGLLLQKKSATDVISGTMKTVVGFMVFNIGSSAMSTVVQTFTDLFNTAFGIEGVTTQVEVATGLALNTYGTEVALVMLLGFVVNLLVAKFTKFKAIFLTGQHFLYFACVIALIFIANGLPMPVTVIELTHSGECGLFFIKLSSSPDLYSIIVLSLLFEGMCCYE